MLHYNILAKNELTYFYINVKSLLINPWNLIIKNRVFYASRFFFFKKVINE